MFYTSEAMKKTKKPELDRVKKNKNESLFAITRRVTYTDKPVNGLNPGVNVTSKQ